MLKRITMALALASLGLSVFAAAAIAADKVIIGHFGNPTPMQAARMEDKFKATGWDIEWRKFNSGAEVIAALASGDVKLTELGSSPFATAASQGVNVQMFMIAQVIGTAESLIARNGAGIAKLEDLKGKRVAVPVGSTAHFSLMGALKHAGLSDSDVAIISMPPDQIAAAWQQDAIDAAFIWQPVQSELLKKGKLLVGADQIADWGYPTFDGWIVDKTFAAQNTAALASFAKVIDEANKSYLANPAAFTPDNPEVKAIAKATGAAPDQVPTILKGYRLLPLADQLAFLAKAPAVLKTTAEFLKRVGRIDTVAPDYSPFVNTEIIKKAGG
jgi:taurine transport system substrate-binding protein